MNQTTKVARTPAHDVHMTGLRQCLALTPAHLRSIHSHDGGIRSAAYGVRAANGLEALRLVAWFAIGPVDIGTTVPEEIDGRVVHALDVDNGAGARPGAPTIFVPVPLFL